MATASVVDPGIVDAELRDLWCSLYLLREEFTHQRWGTPGYDLRGDHAWETLDVALSTLDRLIGR